MSIKKHTPTRHGPPKYGLAIDWETSGADYSDSEELIKKYQGISFGAIIFDTETFEEVDSLYQEIKFDSTKYQWMMEAQAVHGISQEYLETQGTDRETALVHLMEVLIKWMGPKPDKIMFLGHNVRFDILFTKQLFNDFGLELTPYRLNLDSSVVGYVAAGLYKSDDVFDVFADSERGDGTHNALDDCRLALTAVRNMREIFMIGLG